jgi:iron complex outermembrane receptor protein
MTINSNRRRQTMTVAAAVALAIATASAARATETAAADAGGDNSELLEVVVTGTRQGGLTAAESPAPIQILSAEALQAAAGNPDLMSVLAQVVPSVTMEAFGFDMAGQTLMAKMRGLSPNHVLILINGKRRHTTANIAIDTGSVYTGGANVDLNFIPLDAIDHIEVLTEGAAAQYGTDAIAGVINIILKKKTSGGSITATDGKYFDNQGPTGDVSGTAGFEPYDGAYFDVTGEVHNHGHTYHNDVDPHAINDIGSYPNSNMTEANNYPYLNLIQGDGEIHTKLAMLNSGGKLGDNVDWYATGSYGHKDASSFENYRTPTHVSYTDGAGTTTYPFPLGFNPREATDETDYQINAGVKGVVSEWNWDLAYGYGKDRAILETLDSIGDTYYLNGLPTPANFYDGFLQSTQATTTLDINRDFDIGTAGPLNLAFGAEYRYETYKIGAGTPESYLAGGAQSYPGFTPADAGTNSRKNAAVYVDVADKPIEPLRVDIAGRYEHYSDFGNATVGKETARYDFSPQFAIRETISNGFRAPTLAEEYYSSTNVGPSSAFVQLPPNSVGGKLLGLGNGLQPEKSINYSLGFVFKPIPALTMTLDLYQINVTNRIVNTQDVFALENGAATPAAPFINAAITANGTTLAPGLLYTGIEVFANGIDTRTRGADFVMDFPVDYAVGHVTYTIGATFNETDVTKVPSPPAAFTGQAFYDIAAISDLTTANPKYIVNLGAAYSFEKLTVTLTEKIYGPASEYENDNGDNPTGNSEYFRSSMGVTPITNLDVGFNATKNVKFSIGAINLFNRFPPNENATLTAHYFAYDNNSAASNKEGFSPFGIDGGFYYAKASFSW